MIVPSWFDIVRTVEELSELKPLPPEEDGQFEFKSSKASKDAIAGKLVIAASAFWNAGGGIFVWGVDGFGTPDGGVPTKIGRQPIRDWVDELLLKVHPPGPYGVQVLPVAGDDENSLGVLLVAFGESSIAPHMAPDSRYYLRAGALSVQANAFIVEALFARRQLARPMLRHILRINPQHATSVQLGVVAATASPALNVTVIVPPSPLGGSVAKTYQIALIGPGTPFFVDIAFLTMEPTHEVFELRIQYEDVAERQYDETFTVDIDSQMGPPIHDQTQNRLLGSVRGIARSLEMIAEQTLKSSPKGR